MALEAFLNFTKTFSVSPERDKNSQGYWPHYRPQELLSWLHERSTDFRLITYYYPGEAAPRVRLVNTLDQLELLLINVDFDAPPPLNRNLGLEYLAELGDAWGDVQDRKNWPPEIQAKYPEGKPRPMTLLEAVEDITNRKSIQGFDNIETLINLYVGLPKLPPCHRDIPGEPVDRQAPMGGAQYFMPKETVLDFQIRLYNIWQVISVLKENTPGSGIGFNGGLEVLRDLFFEVNYSTPEKLRDPKAGDKNNLKLIMRFVRMGIFRQMGRLLQDSDKNDPVVTDFFATLVHGADAPNFKETMSTLLGKPHAFLWKQIELIFEILDRGSAQSVSHAKQLGLYGMAVLNHLDPIEGPQSGLTNRMMQAMNEGIRDFGEWFLTQDDFMYEGYTSEFLSSLLREVYDESDPRVLARMSESMMESLPYTHSALEITKAVFGKEDSKSEWRRMRSGAEKLVALKEYQSLDLAGAARPILDFFEQDKGMTDAEIELSNRIRLRIGRLIEKGDMNEFLLLAKNQPEKFQKVVQTLSHSLGTTEQGDLKDFFQLIRRSLDDKRF